MKKRDTGLKIILGVFIMVICLSWFWWAVFGRFFDSTNYENRELAPMPQLTAENYRTFTEEFTAYFNDHLPFRSALITLNNAIDYFLFGRSPSEFVIAGEDGWLFYSKESDGDPVGCYEGTNLLSEKDLEALVRNCVKQRDCLREQGREFVIFIIPNKERVYSEYMPAQYGQPAEQYRALQIYNYLIENTDLRVIYPLGEMMDAKEKAGTEIYYKTDTHWNGVGAYAGASALLRELGIEMPEVDSAEIDIAQSGQTAGDLADMLHLTGLMRSADCEYSVTGYDTHDCRELAWDGDVPAGFRAENADPRTLYVVRDSFGKQLAEYVGSQFDKCYLRHRDSFTAEDLEGGDPDIVVYETAERYVGQLRGFSVQ